jgi:hypothetical protein
MPVKFTWTDLYDDDVAVAGYPIWTKVVDFIEGKKTVRITATGSWRVAGKSCGPDGSHELPAGLRAVADPPAGALLAKIGGSTVAKKDETIVAIGSYCTILTADSGGALFLAVNADPSLLSANDPIHVIAAIKD